MINVVVSHFVAGIFFLFIYTLYLYNTESIAYSLQIDMASCVPVSTGFPFGTSNQRPRHWKPTITTTTTTARNCSNIIIFYSAKAAKEWSSYRLCLVANPPILPSACYGYKCFQCNRESEEVPLNLYCFYARRNNCSTVIWIVIIGIAINDRIDR